VDRTKLAPNAAVVCIAASLALVASDGVAAAQSLPASGRYQCTGPSGAMAELDFTVGPGNLYTTTKGWRGTLAVHPLSGNILFQGPTPQNPYQGRYSPGPPPQIVLLTVLGGTSADAGITCRMR
jgi:hypothetical protein